MKYRPDIDGLRAVAVLPVILFHAGFSPFSGGFVGVDVFFVISGYLITSIILEEQACGTFSLAHFWERRIRRILPALFAVMAFCLPLAWVYLLPIDLVAFAKSLIAVSTYTSNIFFWRQSGYFDAITEFKPLIHTWSLAVEEQYYVLFPIFMMVFKFLGRRNVAILLGCLFLLSLATAQIGLLYDTSAVFFLLPTRGWELIVGALVAFYLHGRIAKGSQSLSALGLLMIVVSLTCYNQNTPFPSIYALLPTLGVALVIVYATPETWVYKLLSWKVFVAIGLVSYSAYLWHQPLFAFARHAYGDPSWQIMAGLTVATFCMAYLSWRFIEAPFRNRAAFGRKTVFTFAAIGTLFFIGVGVLGVWTQGFRYRLPANVEWQRLGEKIESVGEICTPQSHQRLGFMDYCYFGDMAAENTIALYGDSHAQALAFAMGQRFKQEGLRGMRIWVKRCEVVPHIRTTRTARVRTMETCLDNIKKAKFFLQENAHGIIMSARWTMKMYPAVGITSPHYNNGEGGIELDLGYRQYVAYKDDKSFSIQSSDKQKAMEKFLAWVDALDMPVGLVYPIPEVGLDVAKENYKYYRKTGRILQDISTSHENFSARNQFVNKIFDDYAFANGKVVRIKPEDIFCRKQIGRCIVQKDTEPLYFDDDHLSDRGAALVIDTFLKAYR